MPIDFPSSPTNGQTYSFSGKTWEWDGVAWLSVTSTPSVQRIREDIAGTKNGSNDTFTITQSGTYVDVYKNGILLKEGVGYTISGTDITALSTYEPNSSDVYEAVIYTGAARIREDVSGTKNGSNDTFTITLSTGQLELFRNGSLLKEGVGYIRSGTTITMQSGYIPNSTDTLEAIIYT